MRRLSITFLLAAGLTAAMARPASAVPANVLVDATPVQPASHAGAKLASRGRVIVAVWQDVQSTAANEQRVYYAVSSDSGASYQDMGPLPAFTNGANAWRWRGDPQIAVDPAGYAYVVAQANGITGGGAGLVAVKGTFTPTGITWGTPAVFRTGVTFTTAGSVGHLALAFKAGTLHLLVANGGNIEHQLSPNGGASWTGPMTISSVADAGGCFYPRLVAGTGLQDVYGAWAGPVGEASEAIRFRAYGFNGILWDPEETAAIMRMNPATAIAINLNTRRTGFSMALNNVTGSSTAGTIALAWSETWNFSDDAFPALTTTPFHDEHEPNDVWPTGTTFTVGEALRGAIASSTDVDFWRMELVAGQPIQFWFDSTNTATQYPVDVVDRDGLHVITSGIVGGIASAFTFTAPISGTYYLRIGDYGAVNYRIRTRAGVPGPGEARDVRDLTTATRPPAGGWSVRHWAMDAAGYDDYLPTIGYGQDGLDYVTWFDMAKVGLGSKAHFVVARNLAGADPVAALPEIVTDSPASWDSMYMYVPPGQGYVNDVQSDDRRVHLAWNDSRLGSPNVYAARIPTTAEILGCPNDVTVTAGQTAIVTLPLYNHNTLFPEVDFVHVSGGRAWPGALTVRDSVPPNTSGVLHIPVTVPDTAAAGTYTLSLSVNRQSGIAFPGGCTAKLLIQAAGAVEGERTFATRLLPVLPNPARGSATIRFELAASARVHLAVYGIGGERVRTLLDGDAPAGTHELRWDGARESGGRVAPGIYLVKFDGPGVRDSRRVVMVR